jgi:hypothetical protein
MRALCFGSAAFALLQAALEGIHLPLEAAQLPCGGPAV